MKYPSAVFVSQVAKKSGLIFYKIALPLLIKSDIL